MANAIIGGKDISVPASVNIVISRTAVHDNRYPVRRDDPSAHSPKPAWTDNLLPQGQHRRTIGRTPESEGHLTKESLQTRVNAISVLECRPPSFLLSSVPCGIQIANLEVTRVPICVQAGFSFFNDI